MATLAGLFILIVVASVMWGENLQTYAVRALPGIGVIAVVWVAVTIRRARARCRQRLSRGPLSYDELRKARSKLVKSQSPGN